MSTSVPHDLVVYVAVRESPLGEYVDLQSVSATPEQARQVVIEADKTRPPEFVENYKPKSIRKMRLTGCS